MKERDLARNSLWIVLAHKFYQIQKRLGMWVLLGYEIKAPFPTFYCRNWKWTESHFRWPNHGWKKQASINHRLQQILRYPDIKSIQSINSSGNFSQNIAHYTHKMFDAKRRTAHWTVLLLPYVWSLWLWGGKSFFYPWAYPVWRPYINCTFNSSRLSESIKAVEHA